MIRYFSYFFILIILLLCNCQKYKLQNILDENTTTEFVGVYQVINISGIVNGEISLKVSDGHYFCGTDIPFGYGAGKIEIKMKTIEFTDTFFFPRQSLYVTNEFHGEYEYLFDGEFLEIWKENDGIREYDYSLNKIK